MHECIEKVLKFVQQTTFKITWAPKFPALLFPVQAIALPAMAIHTTENTVDQMPVCWTLNNNK